MIQAGTLSIEETSPMISIPPITANLLGFDVISEAVN